MYEYNGEGQKYLFTIYDDNTLKLALCKNEELIYKDNVRIYDIGGKGGQRIEYGTSTSKSSLPFKGYSDGNLDKRWEKLK